MILKRLREEAEILQKHLSGESPDLTFILTHADSILEGAEALSAGLFHGETSDEERDMVARYQEEVRQGIAFNYRSAHPKRGPTQFISRTG